MGRNKTKQNKIKTKKTKKVERDKCLVLLSEVSEGSCTLLSSKETCLSTENHRNACHFDCSEWICIYIQSAWKEGEQKIATKGPRKYYENVF